jgi:hypothetical protein
MGCGLPTAPAVALDVCARLTVSGQTLVKLILAVFGIAGILIVVWLLLWISAGKPKE